MMSRRAYQAEARLFEADGRGLYRPAGREGGDVVNPHAPHIVDVVFRMHGGDILLVGRHCRHKFYPILDDIEDGLHPPRRSGRVQRVRPLKIIVEDNFQCFTFLSA